MTLVKMPELRSNCGRAQPDSPHGEEHPTSAIEFVMHPLFRHRDADDLIEELKPADDPTFAKPATRTESQSLSDGRMLPIRLDLPLLSRDAERYLFLKMNWRKFQAARLAERIDRGEVGRGLTERVEALLAEATEVRNLIVESNLRLAVSIARSFASARHPLDELFSECQASLIRAVELYDVEHGFNFSTYATHAVRNSLGRAVQRLTRTAQRTASVEECLLETAADHRTSMTEVELRQMRQRELVARYLSVLPRRERQIVSARFGLDDGEGERTFREVGQLFGISKERVRVLANRALARMQEVARCSESSVIEDMSC